MSETVRIAVCGTGFARYGHLPGFRHTPGAEVVAICSTPLADAQAAADQFDIPRAYDNWERMLAEEPLDLVTIGFPPFLHYPVTMAALAAGCHVLCEKPMALNSHEARAMLAEAEQRGVVHMIDHQLRFNPSYRRTKQLINDGFVGQVLHIHWHNVVGFRADPTQPWTWFSDKDRGGGSLLGGACHAVDLIRWLGGEVRSVSGQLATWVPQRPLPGSGELRPVTSDDQFGLVLELASGALAWCFTTSVARHPTGLRIEIIGSEGTLTIPDEVHLYGARTGETMRDLSVPDPNATLAGVADHIWGQSFVGVAHELVAAIREGRPLREGATFHDGWRTQTVLDAARQSWHERRWVEVPTR